MKQVSFVLVEIGCQELLYKTGSDERSTVQEGSLVQEANNLVQAKCGLCEGFV